MSNKPFNFSCRSPQTIVHLHTHIHTYIEHIYIDYMHLCQYEFNWNECLYAGGMQAKHKSCHFFLPSFLRSMLPCAMTSMTTTQTFFYYWMHTHILWSCFINKLSLISHCVALLTMISHFTANLLYLMTDSQLSKNFNCCN